MRTLAAVAVVVLALPCATHAAGSPTARQVIDGAGAKVKGMAGQRWVTRGMKRVIGHAFATIEGYELIGGGAAARGEGSLDTSLGGTFASVPVGERVHLTGSANRDERRGVRETHHVGASLDITRLEIGASAFDNQTDRGRTRLLEVTGTLPPRAPANARERRLADRSGLFWPGKLTLTHRLSEPAVGREGPATRKRTKTLRQIEPGVDHKGVQTPFDLAERDAATSLTAQLARARTARGGRLTPAQRGSVTRALGEIDTLLARGGYTLEHRIEEGLNQVVATFPGGERLAFTTMDLGDQRATIELTDGARRLELSHGDDTIQVVRRRPRAFAAGVGQESRTMASHRFGERVHVERIAATERPLSPAEAARVAGD